MRECYQRGWPAYGMKGLHASVGLYSTWDDHEVGNNWNPETHDPVALAAARRAFFEHHPIRRNDEDPWRIWRRFRWGRTVEVFVLDCRGERLPSTRHTAHATYLSRAQMDWLKDGLASSPCAFKVVVNSVPITNFPGIFDLEVLGNGRPDRWEGYPAQREEILRHVRDAGLRGVYWLSGDFHFGAVTRIEGEGPYSDMREVLMGPGLNIGNTFAEGLRGSQYDFLGLACSFCVFRADPVRETFDVRFVGADGNTLFGSTYGR
jgi:alkaline phosphatase D